MADRKAFTLLEVILALALTMVTVILMGTAIHVNAGVTEKSRDQVEEAQLARALLQRIADDLRNAVPYQPPAGGSSSSSSSNSSGGTSTSATQAMSATSAGSGASSSSGSAAGSSSSSGTSNPSMPVSGGLFGDVQSLQIETAHRPRLTRAMLAAVEDGSQPSMLSDIRIVNYSFGPPTGAAPTGLSSSGNAAGGVYRSEMDRSLFYMAVQQGQSNPSNPVKLGDPTVGEVIDLKFTYYDGTTANDEWDSNQQGKLPSAVRVVLTIHSARRSRGSSLGGLGLGGASREQRDAVYDMLVDLPNAPVPASEFQSLSQVDKSASGGSNGGGPGGPSGGGGTGGGGPSGGGGTGGGGAGGG
jgi:hypothetical protein